MEWGEAGRWGRGGGGGGRKAGKQGKLWRDTAVVSQIQGGNNTAAMPLLFLPFSRL